MTNAQLIQALQACPPDERPVILMHVPGDQIIAIRILDAKPAGAVIWDEASNQECVTVVQVDSAITWAVPETLRVPEKSTEEPK